MTPADVLTLCLVVGTFLLLAVPRLGPYRLERSATAAIGALLVVVLGAVGPVAAVRAIDAETLLLLFGMMVHVEALSESGFYGWATTRLVSLAGTTRRLALSTLALAAVLSAVALNDAVVLLLTPMLVRALRESEADPVPTLLAVVLGANVGSVATPLGNPQNAYVLANSGLSTSLFVRTLAPVALGSILVAGVVLYPFTVPTRLRAVPQEPYDGRWALVSLGFVLATLVVLPVWPAAPPGTLTTGVAIAHLAWVGTFRRVPVWTVLGGVDWGLLVLFCGMFVLVAALAETGVVAAFGPLHGWRLAATTFGLSNVVSNVPAVVLLSTAVSGTREWLVLAAVSTLAGNATPIASAATLIVLERARRAGVVIPLRRLLTVGVPVAVLTGLGACVVLLG